MFDTRKISNVKILNHGEFDESSEFTVKLTSALSFRCFDIESFFSFNIWKLIETMLFFELNDFRMISEYQILFTQTYCAIFFWVNCWKNLLSWKITKLITHVLSLKFRSKFQSVSVNYWNFARLRTDGV